MIRRANTLASQFDYTVKIILLGDHSVGKTSFLAQLAADDSGDVTTCRCLSFRPNCQVELEVKCHGKTILVKVTDTGGQERFRSITASYYRGAQGCLVMFDAEKPDTFSHVYQWHSDLETYTNGQFLSKFLVGVNINSSRKQVTQEQASRLATQLEMQFHGFDPSNKRSAVGLIKALLDLVMVTASRMPSLTIDIRPNLVLTDLSEQREGMEGSGDRKKRKGKRSLGSQGTADSWDDHPGKYQCLC